MSDYERRPGRNDARAVVSVAFSREDFDRVAREAEARGVTLSAFIREAALARCPENVTDCSAEVTWTLEEVK